MTATKKRKKRWRRVGGKRVHDNDVAEAQAAAAVRHSIRSKEKRDETGRGCYIDRPEEPERPEPGTARHRVARSFDLGTHKDATLAQQAIKKRWETSDAVKKALLDQAALIGLQGEDEKNQLRGIAIYLAAERQNQIDEQRGDIGLVVHATTTEHERAAAIGFIVAELRRRNVPGLGASGGDPGGVGQAVPFDGSVGGAAIDPDRILEADPGGDAIDHGGVGDTDRDIIDGGGVSGEDAV